MQIKVRKVNKDGHVRLRTRGAIKEVLINEDLMEPGSESISICFRGRDSSGIIDLSPMEFDLLYNSVKQRIHLIKGLRVLRGKGI